MAKRSIGTKNYQIANILPLNQDTKLLTLEGHLKFSPGQTVEARLPGYGEAPFAPTSNPSNSREWQLCVRKAGTVTRAVHRLEASDQIQVRGPLGHGWPLDKLDRKTVVIVAGGLGIIPLRPLILSLVDKKIHNNLHLFYGSRRPEELLFQDDLEKWKSCTSCHLTIDKECSDWTGEVGFVTDCLEKAQLKPKESVALVCGPPVMFKNAVGVLKRKGFKDDQIYVSLERKMQCGIGKCQHCAVGPYYVCQDGPVFNYRELVKVEAEV